MARFKKTYVMLRMTNIFGNFVVSLKPFIQYLRKVADKLNKREMVNFS